MAAFQDAGSIHVWNAHALPRERPLARRATPRILDVFARSATRRAAVLVATPNLKNHSTGMPEIARMAASFVTCLARPNGAPHFLPCARFRAFACAFHT
ncbi:hypothetical protein F3J14_22190 [Burkholderia sp. Tr-862]|nr:hypothetical protein [Burkholderia sp. Tr-862]